jgi:hypothetical protein
MERIKRYKCAKWEVTDLEKYIAANLECEGLQYANAVAMPLDPNAKLEPVVQRGENPTTSHIWQSLL